MNSTENQSETQVQPAASQLSDWLWLGVMLVLLVLGRAFHPSALKAQPSATAPQQLVLPATTQLPTDYSVFYANYISTKAVK